MDVLVVTGMSGAGKSTSLDALEDLGFYCVDNLPVPLLERLVETVRQGDSNRRLAVGVDAREADFLASFPEMHRKLLAAGHALEILFLGAPVDVLVRRYSETRRKHPLGDLPGAIEQELALLEPLRSVASVTIDTATSTARQLRQNIRDRYGTRGQLRLVLMSFAYRYGIPSEADVVIDARFLANPFEVSELRPLSGLDNRVARHVLDQGDARALLDQVKELVRFMAPRIAREGRSSFTFALGCTGGRHRSVALVEALEAQLATEAPLWQSPAILVVRHRDVGKP